jgi:hypothetical protein
MNQPDAPARTAEPGALVRPDPPRSVMVAVRIMYAGAALTAIGLVISVVGVATGEKALRASHRHATLAQLHATQNFLITLAVVSGLIEIGAWLLMARANRSGLKWARIVATVLFALGTWNLISHIIGTATVTNLAYTALMWLVGFGAVFFLWQKDSSGYFT